MEPKERIKMIREDMNKTQKEMAGLVSVGFRTWQAYEEGLHDPSWKVVTKLTELGYNADWLASGEGPMKRGDVEYPDSDELMAAGACGDMRVGFTDASGNKLEIDTRKRRNIFEKMVMDAMPQMTLEEQESVVKMVIEVVMGKNKAGTP